MKVNGVQQQFFFPDILKNIHFFVQQKKDIYSGLEQLEGE